MIFPSPQLQCSNYARLLLRVCSMVQFQQLWLTIPLHAPLHYSTCSSVPSDDGWLLWNAVRTYTSHHHRLFILLDLTALPQDMTESALNRWSGEPLKGIIMHTHHFIKNKSGFPVLSKPWQDLLLRFLRLGVYVILRGKARIKNSPTPYIEYLRFLRSKASEHLSDTERALVSYRDTLQMPLQPLMDNLESSTYETFESDSPKYTQYQAAIEKALPRVSSGADEVITVFVVGAGRGPLVKCALNAARAVGCSLRVYAVEKNANAIITLQNRIMMDGWTNVTIVASDMREWTSPHPAHIIVSELLGSWGDNELSPECLDAVSRFLLPQGAMIPASYTSYVAPLTASRVWMGARDIPGGKGLETPFVVKLHAVDYICPSIPLFTFVHPGPAPPDHRRYGTASFVADKDCMMHGIAGTFITSLYGDVMLSTVPETHTDDMHSWFPLFIPLAIPVSLKADDVVKLHFWRCNDSITRKVWYEWCLSSPLALPIQNSGGKSYWIGL